MLHAQVWYGPARHSPENYRCSTADCSGELEIKNISELGGDNLGDHTARFNLNLNSYNITGVQSLDTTPAISVTAGAAATGFSVVASGGSGVYALSTSGSSTFSAANQGAGVALNVSSAGSYSAALVGLVVIDNGGLILGSNSQDSFSVGSAGTAAVNDIFWGSSLLCDVSQTNCGYGASAADNLGTLAGTTLNPHRATRRLDMDSFAIYNLGSSDSSSSLNTSNPTLSVSHVGSTLVASASLIKNEVGTPSAVPQTVAIFGTSSSTNATYGGVVASHLGSGVGLIASSSTGLAAKFLGEVLITGGSINTSDVVFFDEVSELGRLGIQSNNEAGADLYWGNMLLCDASEDNCGWGGTSTAHWKQNSSYTANIYYDQGNVGIQETLPTYQFHVGGTGTVSGPTGYIGNLYAYASDFREDVVISNDLYVSDALEALPSRTGNGMFVGGDLIVPSGQTIQILGVTLSESDLDPSNPTSMVAKCIAASICTAP